MNKRLIRTATLGALLMLSVFAGGCAKPEAKTTDGFVEGTETTRKGNVGTKGGTAVTRPDATHPAPNTLQPKSKSGLSL